MDAKENARRIIQFDRPERVVMSPPVFEMGIAAHYLEHGVEFVNLGDDLGTQLGPLVSPDRIEAFLMPEYERLFELYRERDVLIGFHSCGNVESMLGFFMRLGVG